MLPEPSQEQKKIVDTLLSDSNVVVQAVAGSGKTTTICYVGKALPQANILLLTYNKRLKHETKTRLNQNKITNIHVHNYHSFCFNKYDVYGNTDQIILDVLAEKERNSDSEIKLKYEYDIIIIDEAQDMTPLYFKLVQLIISENKFPPKICLLGDPFQTIYDFNGADLRFITLGTEIFKVNKFPWVKLTLSVSYRLTPKICDFINECVLKKPGYIKAANTTNLDCKPRYIFCDAFGTAPIKELTHHYLVKFGYTYNDIFILAPSIQSDLSPVKALANKLSSNYSIPIFVPGSDGEKLDSDTIANKLVFATFHQAKGLERRCVIIFSFDSSYFHYYKQDTDKSQCPNEIYVGLTRCSERLTVIHHYKKNYLECIDQEKIKDHCYTERISSTGLNLEWFKKNKIDPIKTRVCDLMNFEESGFSKPIDAIMELNNWSGSLKKKIKISVTKLISHLPTHIISQALTCVQINKVKNLNLNKKFNSNIINPFDQEDNILVDPHDDYYININSKITSNININIIENVSEIIGTAIPIYYEYNKTKKISIIPHIEKMLSIYCHPSKTSVDNVYRFAKNKYIELIKQKDSFDSTQIFELVGIYLALSNNLIHKISQITNYKFVTKTNLNLCVKRLDYNLGKNSHFEQYYESDITVDVSGHDVPVTRTINGFMDCIDNGTLWEFKCTNEIQPVHLLQLVIYAWMHWDNERITKAYTILNILSGEKISIQAKPDNLRKAVELILQYKFAKIIKLTDDEFMEKILQQ